MIIEGLKFYIFKRLVEKMNEKILIIFCRVTEL